MAEAANDGGHVLVVSDDDHVRDEARFGFAPTLGVALARDAREALAQMQTDVPVVVIMDLHTGSAGGFALCKDMRQFAHLRDVPVLMLLDREQDRWLADQAGAALVRTKPLDPSDLVQDTLSLIS